MLEDAPHDKRIVDQREYAHRAVALRTFEWIGFVDLANQPRPSRLGARGELAHGLDGRYARRRRILALLSLRPLPARAIGVPADIAHQVLVAVRDVPAQQLQPLRPGHHLEVSLQPEVHLGAIDDGAGGRVVGHLLKGHRGAQLPGDGGVPNEKLQHRAPKPLDEKRLGHRRQGIREPAWCRR